MGLVVAAKGGGAATALWILAVVLAIAGVVSLIGGQVMSGVVLIVIACLVGPAGVSLFI